MDNIQINKLNWTVKWSDANTISALAEQNKSTGYAFGQIDIVYLQILLNKEIHPDLIFKTIVHELIHAYLFSYGWTKYTYDEEQICDFISSHIVDLITNANKILLDYNNQQKESKNKEETVDDSNNQ